MRRISWYQMGVLPIILMGCSSPPKPPPIPAELLKGAVLTPATLQAGCLLPEPSLLSIVKVPASINVNVKVNALGRPTEVRVLESSGQGDLDDAFVTAAKNCSFSPAMADGIRTDYWYNLRYSWVPKQSFAGPARCFPLPYPRSALRSGETDTVQVKFRIRSDSNAVETRFSSAKNSLLLTPMSVSSVERCLNHSEARQGLDVDRWYSIAFEWRIQE